MISAGSMRKSMGLAVDRMDVYKLVVLFEWTLDIFKPNFVARFASWRLCDHQL